MEIYFPEFNTVFKKWTGKVALLTLKHFPTSQAVIEMGEEKIVAIWKQKVAVAGFQGAVGDIGRFDSPEQIVKILGLNLKENSSGKHKGKTTITRRDCSDGRYVIFQAVLPLVARNSEFRQLHLYYINRENKPLKKMRSMVANSFISSVN